MATRSRRSAGGDSLNPAMIQLYDTGRLRRELKQRGLDTTGNRNVLADRLQEAVLSERNSRQTYSPPPQQEKSTKRGAKRGAAKVSEGNENESAAARDVEHSSSPKAKKIRLNEEVDAFNLIEESFSIELSNISSIDEVQMEAEKAFMSHIVPPTATTQKPCLEPQGGTLTPANKETDSVAETTSEKTDVIQPTVQTPEIKIRIRSPKKPQSSRDGSKQHVEKRQRRVRQQKAVEEEEQQASSSDEELKWLNKTRREKRARKALLEERQAFVEDIPGNEKEFGMRQSPTEEGETIQKGDGESARERSCKSSSVESSKAEGISLKEKSSKPSERKHSIKIKFKANILNSSIERTAEPKREGSASGSGSLSGKEEKGHVGMASTSEAVTSKEPSQERTKCLPTPPPSSSGEKAKEQPPRKKIPLRMQAPVDVLDSIFDQQAELLSTKYKTEQERALERQKLEMAKRRQSAVSAVASSTSSAVLEKRRHTVDFVLPPKASPEERVAPARPPPDFRPRQPPSSQHFVRGKHAVDEKRMLAKLPPPPPPPPLLPCPTRAAQPSTSSPTLSSSSLPERPRDESLEGISVEKSFATPIIPGSNDSPHSIRTPPSVPCYQSPSEASVENLCASEESNSSPGEKTPSERIKEMASALQAVFARLGSVPPPPAPPELDNNSSGIMDSDSGPLPQGDSLASVAEKRNEENTKVITVGNEPGALDVKSGSPLVAVGDADHGEVVDSTGVQEIPSSSISLLQESDPSTPMQASFSPSDTTQFVEEVAAQLLKEGVENASDEQIIASVVEEVISAAVKLSTSDTGFVMECDNAHDGADREGMERKPAISEELLRDPRRLLQKASDVLKSLQSLENSAEPSAAEKLNQQYEQLPLDEKYEEEEDEDKPLPEFHGEPVPDSDDEVIIEGVTRKRSAKKNVVQEEEPVPGDEQIEIDFYNADLNIKASETCQEIIDPDNGDGFALMWGGVRSTYGIQIPADVTELPIIIFQIKLLECLPIKHLPFEEPDAYDVRVGWSTLNSTNILGEAPYSYAYSSLAKKATNNFFTDYGEFCVVGDVITSCLDLASGKIHFWKNTEYLGVAFSDVSFENDDTVCPHVCTKNYKLSVNYGDSHSEGWIPITELQKDDEVLGADFAPVYFSKLDRTVLVRGLIPPTSKSECTVLMMVGLPGVGKTTWVRQYLREHPREQWTLLSTDTVLAAMKVNGVARSRIHQGRWDMIMGLVAKALNRSLHLACRRRRNYIIDQTNVSKEARRRKLSQFKDFQRKCVVIIPSEDEMIERQMKQSRTDGAGSIPVEAMLELKAMLSIPNVETEPIEDVFFVEPPLERIGDAIDLVQKFNEEARPWCQKRRGRRGELLRQGEPRMANTRTSNGYRFQDFTTVKLHHYTYLDTPSVTTNTNASEGNQSNGQPSPTITRPNEGYCGFGREMPSSLTSSAASSWAERKSASIS